MNSGIYSLIIKLTKSSSITIGKLGRFKFPKGYYIYTGSAEKNLSQRIDRHKRKNNKGHSSKVLLHLLFELHPLLG